jgi:hypothetical protein
MTLILKWNEALNEFMKNGNLETQNALKEVRKNLLREKRRAEKLAIQIFREVPTERLPHQCQRSIRHNQTNHERFPITP